MAPDMMSVTDNENVTRWSLENGYEDLGSNDTEIYPFRVVNFNSKP